MNRVQTDTGDAKVISMAEAIDARGKQAEADPDLILDPRDPMRTARHMVTNKFTGDNGLRLMHRHRGTFWVFSQSHYRPVDDEEARAEVWQYLDHAFKLEKNKAVPFQPNSARVSEVLDALRATCGLPTHIEPPTWLGKTNRPPASEFLSVENGLLHLPSRELSPATPAYFNLSASGVEFDDSAEPPRLWLQFLGELWGDDGQAIEALQDWFGYGLSSDTTQQKILLLVGPTRSGKGTIARVQSGVVGTVAGPTLKSLSSNFGLAELIGKPLAIISDARLGRTDHAVIAERLLSISGEDILTIDRKHKTAWTGHLPTRFMVLTNELPQLNDSSGALAKRFIVLTLKQSFYGREDPALTKNLLTELPGILNWALDGYERLRNRGYFIQPESAQEEIDELEALASPVKAFMKDKCETAPGMEVAVDTLYEAWCGWCEKTGRRPGTVQTFGRNLRSAFPALQVRQPRDGKDRHRVYEGIALS